MAKIDSILKPLTISYDDYDIMFAIPRYSPQPMVLDSKEKYAYLVEHVLKAKASQSVKIIIEAKVLDKKKVSISFPSLSSTHAFFLSDAGWERQRKRD
jgi:hypothetical protein